MRYGLTMDGVVLPDPGTSADNGSRLLLLARLDKYIVLRIRVLIRCDPCFCLDNDNFLKMVRANSGSPEAGNTGRKVLEPPG